MCRIGMPSGIINMVQEMGRCSQSRTTQIVEDNFNMCLNLEDFVYLNQRLILPQVKHAPNVIRIISSSEEIKMQWSTLIE